MFDTEKYFPERCLLPERRLHTWAFQIMEFDVGDCLSGDLVIAAQELEASGNLTSFGGKIRVPSYRGSTFLDPKVRAFLYMNPSFYVPGLLTVLKAHVIRL